MVVVDHDRGCLIWAAGGVEQRGAAPVPQRGTHPRAEAFHRGGDGRRLQVDIDAGQAVVPQCRMGHGPLPRRQPDERRPRRRVPRGVAGGQEGRQGGDAETAASRMAVGRRRDAARLPQTRRGGEGHQGDTPRAGEGQGEPDGEPEGQARQPEVGRVAPVQGMGAQRGPAGRVPGGRRRRGGEAPRRLAPPSGPLQDSEGRGGREEGEKTARRHPPLHIARHQQGPRGVDQQQDQGDGEDGLRLQEHGQPHSAADAEMLGRETAAAVGSAGADRESGLVNQAPNHTNYRSLLKHYRGLRCLRFHFAFMYIRIDSLFA